MNDKKTQKIGFPAFAIMMWVFTIWSICITPFSFSQMHYYKGTVSHVERYTSPPTFSIENLKYHRFELRYGDDPKKTVKQIHIGDTVEVWYDQQKRSELGWIPATRPSEYSYHVTQLKINYKTIVEYSSSYFLTYYIVCAISLIVAIISTIYYFKNDYPSK